MATDCINRRMDYCGLSRNHEIINVEFQIQLILGDKFIQDKEELESLKRIVRM